MDADGSTRAPGVAITGLENADLPQPGAECAGALKEQGKERLVGLLGNEHCSAVVMPGVFDSIVLLENELGSAEWMRELEKLGAEHDFDVLLPTLAEHIEALAARADELRESGIATLLPGEDGLAWMEPTRLPELATSFGVAVLDTACLEDVPGKDAPLPWTPPLRVSAGENAHYVVWLPEELAWACGEFEKRRDMPLIVQPERAGEWFEAAALVDSQHRMVRYAALRMMQTDENGTLWMGVSVTAPELRETLGRLARRLSWRGFLRLRAFREEAAPHARIAFLSAAPPSWAMLAHAAGEDFCSAYVALSRGEGIAPRCEPTTGLLYVRNAWEDIMEMNHFARLVAHREVRHVR